MSSLSLEALLSNPSLYEEIPMEDLDKGPFFFLEDLFGGEAVLGTRELMKDATPSKVVVVISVCF